MMDYYIVLPTDSDNEFPTAKLQGKTIALLSVTICGGRSFWRRWQV